MERLYKYLISLFFIISLFISINVNAIPLIQIEIGDTWSYSINTPISEIVNFTVISYDYAGSGSDQVRINKIESTKIVDPLLAEMYQQEKMFFRGLSTGGGNLTLKLELLNIINDTIYKTSRGNIPFKRDTYANVSFQFIDVNYNDTFLGNFTYINEVYFEQISDNPTIIETVSTGVVKINKVKIYTETNLEDFLSLGSTVIDLDMELEERYEASDEFVYLNQTCRNITITPLSSTMTNLEIGGGWYGFPDRVAVNLTVGEEDWIYGYDLGLPLRIERKANLPSELKYSIEELDSIKMEIINFDIENSNYKFPENQLPENTEENSMILMNSLPVLFVLIFRRFLKRRKIK
jgi:hypothetical protein